MRIITDRNNLLRTINTVIKATAIRSAHPSLEGILIETGDNTISLFATDTNIQINTVTDADIIAKGKVLIPAKIFSDIINKLEYGDVEIDVDENNYITLTCQSSVFNISGMDPATFPNREVYNSNEFIKIENDTLRSMIKETIFSVAGIDSVSPILTGVLIENIDDSINFVALDGVRMAIRTEKLEESFNNYIKCVVPSRTLNELIKILMTYDDKEVYVNINEKKFIANIGKTQIVSNLLQGKFINYKDALPKESSTIVKLDRHEFLASCERASIITDEGKNNLIKMQFEGNELTLRSKSAFGNVVEKLDVSISGDDLEIAFNSKYFIDALKIITDEKVILELGNPNTPCLIKPIDSEKFVYLVMPVRSN